MPGRDHRVVVIGGGFGGLRVTRYMVDRIRDGRSFTTRRVVAVQHGRAIFTLSASFQVPEEGAEHQFTMPDAPAPEATPLWQDRLQIIEGLTSP
jgi:acyl-CoA thioesterase II